MPYSDAATTTDAMTRVYKLGCVVSHPHTVEPNQTLGAIRISSEYTVLGNRQSDHHVMYSHAFNNAVRTISTLPYTSESENEAITTHVFLARINLNGSLSEVASFSLRYDPNLNDVQYESGTSLTDISEPIDKYAFAVARKVSEESQKNIWNIPKKDN